MNLEQKQGIAVFVGMENGSFVGTVWVYDGIKRAETLIP